MAVQILPVQAGRDAHFLGKQFYKILAVGIAHLVGDLVQLEGGVGQKGFGPLHAQFGEPVVDGAPASFFVGAAQVADGLPDRCPHG